MISMFSAAWCGGRQCQPRSSLVTHTPCQYCCNYILTIVSKLMVLIQTCLSHMNYLTLFASTFNFSTKVVISWNNMYMKEFIFYNYWYNFQLFVKLDNPSGFEIVIKQYLITCIVNVLFQLCSLISALEWAVFVCNHRLGTAWRQQLAGTQHSSPVTTEDKRHPLHSRTDVGHDTPLTTGNSMCYTNESRKALLNDYQVHHTQGMNNNVNYFENDSSINGYGSSKQQPALVHWVMKNSEYLHPASYLIVVKQNCIIYDLVFLYFYSEFMQFLLILQLLR